MTTPAPFRGWLAAHSPALGLIVLTLAMPSVVLGGTLLFEDHVSAIGLWRGSASAAQLPGDLLPLFGLGVQAAPYLTAIAWALGVAILVGGSCSRPRTLALALLLGVSGLGAAHVSATADSCWGMAPFPSLSGSMVTP